MTRLNNSIKEKIKAHALRESPNECCGLILEESGEMKVVKCENAAENKAVDFEISVLDYLEASRRGKIKAYYHSHVHDKVGKLSEKDEQVSKAHGLSLIMYSIFHNEFFIAENE